MSIVGDYFFEFPASRGVQGGAIVLMMTVPARTLARVLASDNYGDTLERSQREINPARAKKFYEYLVNAHENKEPFIIPPLVGNCNSEIEFQEFGNTNVGVVRFPMDAEIKLFDGQHRAAGIAEFCRTVGEPIHVPLMLTHKLSLKTRQQFFSDINNNVSKPSAAINMAYIRTMYGERYSYKGFNEAWRKARNAASEELGRPLDCTFHDLKAKGISDYEGSGRDKQKFSGHKTESQVLVYDRKVKISPTLNKKMR